MSSIAIQSRAIYIEEMSQSPSSTPEIDLDPFEDFLCFSVYSTGLAFNRIYKPLLDRLGLTYLQYLAILALARQDDQAVSELGEKLFLESNTLTPSGGAPSFGRGRARGADHPDRQGAGDRRAGPLRACGTAGDDRDCG